MMSCFCGMIDWRNAFSINWKFQKIPKKTAKEVNFSKAKA